MSSENIVQPTNITTNSINNNRRDYSASFLSSFGRYNRSTVTNVIADPATTSTPASSTSGTTTSTPASSTSGTTTSTPASTTSGTTTSTPASTTSGTTTSTPASTTPAPMNGVDRETKILMRETLELISNQIEKFTELVGKDAKSVILKEKLNFWKSAKTQELKIQDRLRTRGVDEDLESHFKNLYEKRSSMLTTKFQQPLKTDSSTGFYEKLNILDSELMQLSAGSTREQIRANKDVTALLAKTIKENRVETKELSKTIKRLETQIKNTTNAAEKARLQDQLTDSKEQRTVMNDKHRALYTASLRFANNARNFTDLDRLQYTQFIKDVENTDGNISVNFLPPFTVTPATTTTGTTTATPATTTTGTTTGTPATTTTTGTTTATPATTTTTTGTTTATPATTTTGTPSPMNGVDRETKILMRETLELISNQIEKFTELVGKDAKSVILKEKLNFWKSAKTQELKIQDRLRTRGVDEDLESHFKNLYEKRSSMLTTKFQQPLKTDSSTGFYEKLNILDSELMQLSAGSTREQIRANKDVTALLAKTIKENRVETKELSNTIKQLETQIKNTTNAAEKARLKAKLTDRKEQRTIMNEKYRDLHNASQRFGAKAKNFTDLDRLQYTQFIKDVEESNGSGSVNYLP